ncbi:hypothetical protein [Rubrolithibacter danxiaensis]|uniref:hypothetical protein n=1 Tax=Rubrolithibacter danxiaensis TaxID=3390805 RepID=UPI003BF82816
MIYFFLIEIGLLATPILAYLLYKKFSINKNIIAWLLGSLSVLALCWFFDISFKGDTLDFVLPISLYISYCYLMFHLFQLKNKLAKFFACFVAAVPILAGYLVATLGILGLMMVSLDFESERTVDLGNDSYFREYGHGNATTDDGGLKVDVYKYLPWFPLLEKRIFSKRLSLMRYETSNLNIKLTTSGDQYNIRIYSNDSLQIDTTVRR